MSNKQLFRYFALALAIVLGAAVLVISVLPINRIDLGTRPSPGSPADSIARAAVLHLFVHIVIFGVLACAVWFALEIAAAGAVNKMIGLSIIMLLGWGAEYLQHRLYDNPLETTDVLTDIFSSAAVYGLLTLWARYRTPPPEPQPEGEHVAYVLRDIE